MLTKPLIACISGSYAGSKTQRPVLTVARDLAVDQVRVRFAEAVRIDAELLRHVGTHVVDEHVGVLGQFVQRANAVGRLQVQNDRTFAAVQGMKRAATHRSRTARRARAPRRRPASRP